MRKQAFIVLLTTRSLNEIKFNHCLTNVVHSILRIEGIVIKTRPVCSAFLAK